MFTCSAVTHSWLIKQSIAASSAAEPDFVCDCAASRTMANRDGQSRWLNVPGTGSTLRTHAVVQIFTRFQKDALNFLRVKLHLKVANFMIGRKMMLHVNLERRVKI